VAAVGWWLEGLFRTCSAPVRCVFRIRPLSCWRIPFGPLGPPVVQRVRNRREGGEERARSVVAARPVGCLLIACLGLAAGFTGSRLSVSGRLAHREPGLGPACSPTGWGPGNEAHRAGRLPGSAG